MGITDQLKSIDQFGAFFQLSIQGDNPQYKSLAGATATFLINSTALIYLAYLFYVWGTDQTVPSVASEQLFKAEGSTFKLQQSPFTFNIEMYSNESLEEYHGKYLYNISTIFFVNDSELSYESYRPECEKLYFMDLLDDSLCLDLNDPNQKKLTQLYKNRLYDDYLGFYLNPCDSEDPNCISEIDSQEFLENIDAEGRLTLMTQQYELGSEHITTIPFDYYFPLSFTQQNVFNLVLKPTKLTVMRGVFFPTAVEVEYISSIDVKFIPNQRPEGDPYAIIWVSLDRSEIQTRIEYPRLPQILAQFSSLFSALMGVGILFNIINGSILRKKMINEIGEIYFFDFKKHSEVKKEGNYFTVMKHKKLKLIRNQLMSKCNFLNIVYEISRLQLAIQTLLPKQQLIQIQKMKYTISEHNNNQKITNNESIFQGLLTEENFELFTMNQKFDEVFSLQSGVFNQQDQIQEIIRANIPNVVESSNEILSFKEINQDEGSQKRRSELSFQNKTKPSNNADRVKSFPGEMRVNL